MAPDGLLRRGPVHASGPLALEVLPGPRGENRVVRSPSVDLVVVREASDMPTLPVLRPTDARAFTRRHDAIGLGATLHSMHMQLARAQLARFASRELATADALRDAVMLTRFATIDTRADGMSRSDDRRERGERGDEYQDPNPLHVVPPRGAPAPQPGLVIAPWSTPMSAAFRAFAVFPVQGVCRRLMGSIAAWGAWRYTRT